ncbi:MAG: nucleotide exchange factor GrpE [Lachnospiraceae bacterium]|nr:nucleotide exchange factor GrpE [Lachnospiraceae bacterium]
MPGAGQRIRAERQDQGGKYRRKGAVPVDQEKQREEAQAAEELQEEYKAGEEPQAGDNVENQENAGEEPEAEAESEAQEQAEEETQQSQGEEAEAEEKEADGGKSFFKKKKKEDKKELRIAELEDRVKRQLAEFENFRNRTEKEKSHMYEVGARDVIEKMLPVVDNFERGLAAVPEDQKSDPFVEGMDKIYKQLMTTLSELGVAPIEAVGQEFDPNFHNAVMHVEDEELGENMVTEEFQKGYLYKETVIRHSMVKVAN